MSEELSSDTRMQQLVALIDQLRELSDETEWVEFKVNNSDPTVIGKRISALSNGARLKDKGTAYLVYGIENSTHRVVGTNFKGAATKTKGQQLQFWLAQHLQPQPLIEFKDVDHPDGRIVMIEISAAAGVPTKFLGVAYIRIGDATPKLGDHPELEKQLWAKLQSYAWESDVALEYCSTERVLELLDYESFFPLLNAGVPTSEDRIAESLEEEKLIRSTVGNRWHILNLGACLLARDMRRFSGRISRKAPRLIQYEDTSRVQAKPEELIVRGYAVGFEALINDIMNITAVENIGSLRMPSQPFPRVAVRELVANCLIHQDMTTTGTGPMIEAFKDRLEITNPGKSLVDPNRFIDAPPRSRNESLAGLMRRMNICEERGSGIDRVITTVEEIHLPAPEFASESEFTRATLFSPRDFSVLTVAERIRACYQHACLLNARGRRATNASLRARFNVAKSNSAHISRVFADTRSAKLIKLADPETPKGGYVPYFA